MRFAAGGCLLLALLALPRVAPGADVEEVAEHSTVPGVVARYEANSPGMLPVVVERVEAAPRLFGRPGELPDPCLPAVPLKIRWSGLLLPPYRGPYTFTVLRNSLADLRLTIDGRAVTLGTPIELESAALPLVIEGTHRGPQLAFELWWRTTSFADEPIEARFFRHDPRDSQAVAVKQQQLADRGALLADSLGCFRCHSTNMGWSTTLGADLTARATLPGPRLDALAKRVNQQWLNQWLMNPAETTHGARMPKLFADTAADRQAASVISQWLTSGATAKTAEARGEVDKGKALYTTAGCAACHAPPAASDVDAEFTSPVPKLENLARKWKSSGLRDFLQQPLETRAHGRMPDFAISTEQAGDLAAYLLSQGDPAPPATEPGTVSEQDLAEVWQLRHPGAGKPPGADPAEQFATVALGELAARRCFNCHELDAAQSRFEIQRRASGSPLLRWKLKIDEPPQAPAPPDLINIGNQRGCLAAGDKKAAPDFALVDADRQALIAFVTQLSHASSPSAMERVRIDLAELNCLRCHANEEHGGAALRGLLGEGEAAKFSTPPLLTRTGERVRLQRLREWLQLGARDQALRPWVGARMPGFGPHGGRLAAALAARDGAAGGALKPGPTVPALGGPQVQNEHLSTGRFLVGTKALACVNCHFLNGTLLAGQPDATTRGPDLARVAAHLRPEYFQRWMMNPARIRPGTKMPQAFQPNGAVPIVALASLAPPGPMNALWTYLSQGASAPPPANEPSLFLAPAPSAPVVQRGEINIGPVKYPRGVAIGFADGTVLFDADQLSCVAAWYDGFVRPAEQSYFGLWWNAAGQQQERFAAVPPALSFQMQADQEWQAFSLPLESDPNTGTRFEGYQLGKAAVRLRYRLLVGDRQVHVTEDVHLEKRPDWRGFVRQVRLSGLPAGARAALRLATGDNQRFVAAAGETSEKTEDVAQAPLVAFDHDAKKRVYSAKAVAGTSWLADTPGSVRLISAVSRQGAPVELRVDAWTCAQNSAPTPAQFAALNANPPTLDDNFELPLAPPARLPEFPPASPEIKASTPVVRTRPPVAHKENVDEFAAAPARFLRFTITATEQNSSPGIDELEVYGADPKLNLALAGKATASSVIPNFPIHQIAHLNDGKLGNQHSWISAEGGKGWAQIEFPESVRVSKVVWARDRTGQVSDRLASAYRIDISDDGVEWNKVIDSSDRQASLSSGLVDPLASPGYLLEAIPSPFPGCRPSGVAFGDDDSLVAIAMTEGQLWRTRRPPDGNAAAVRWQRWASGLYHPIGIQIVDGRTFVAQKPEITELVDRDGDGVVEEFRTAASGWGLSTGWHEYTFGLALDRQKNLWFALNTGFFWTNPGYVNPGRMRGGVLKYSFESDRLEVVAKGCRVPNGIVCGPNGDIFYTDNQGDWIQSCKLAAVVPGRFYGHPETKEDALPAGTFPDGRSAVWLPYNLSRSTSGPAYDSTQGAFGPFAEQMFVGDAGYGANPGILRVALEKVDGEYQGACFRFIDNQPHGCVRMTFGPDKQLYMCSLTTGLTRLKFVGPTPLAMHTVNIRPAGKGFVLRFTKSLAADTQLVASEFRVKRYHYLYTGNYGSPTADETNVPVEAAELSSDRQSITLTLPVESYPIGMVYEINAGKLKADGDEPLVHNEAWYTVHRIPQ